MTGGPFLCSFSLARLVVEVGDGVPALAEVVGGELGPPVAGE